MRTGTAGPAASLVGETPPRLAVAWDVVTDVDGDEEEESGAARTCGTGAPRVPAVAAGEAAVG